MTSDSLLSSAGSRFISGYPRFASAELLHLVLLEKCTSRKPELFVKYFQNKVVDLQRLANEGPDCRFHARIGSFWVSPSGHLWPGEGVVFSDVQEIRSIWLSCSIDGISACGFVSVKLMS